MHQTVLSQDECLSSILKARKAILALLLLSILWGFNWVQMKIGVPYAPPFVFAALRVLLGAIFLFLLLIGLRKPLMPKEIPGTFVVGLLQISGVYGFLELLLQRYSGCLSIALLVNAVQAMKLSKPKEADSSSLEISQ